MRMALPSTMTIRVGSAVCASQFEVRTNRTKIRVKEAANQERLKKHLLLVTKSNAYRQANGA